MAATPEPRAARERRGIQSIEVGGRILLALLDHPKPMALGELARAAGMSGANAHAYLVSYGHLGLVRQDAVTGRYELGPLALQLGLAVLHRQDPIKIAIPLTQALAESCGQTVAVAVMGNLGPVIVHLHESDYPIHVNMRAGTVMSLTRTATGKVFAAYLPAGSMEKMLDADAMRLGDRAAIRDRAQWLAKNREDVRRRGLARALGEPIPGVNALTAPVFDSTGNIVLAITATGTSDLFDANWSGALAKAVAQCAARVSAELGWPGEETRD